MNSTKDRPGCARAESRAVLSPERRLPARRAAALLAALAAAAGFTALAAGGAAAPQPVVTSHLRLVETGSPSPSRGPMVAARSRRAKLGIGLFTAAPSHLPAAGGQVKLTATVQHASSCTFTFARGLGRTPVSTPCRSGRATASVTLPRNTSTADRVFRFEVTVSGRGSSMTAAPVTVIEAAASRRGAPRVTLEPVSATVSAGVAVSFTAAAHGAPSPTVRWQVSADGGHTWTAVPGVRSATFAFTATPGQSGLRYRAVFTNANGSATTAAALLTVQSAASPQVVPVSIVSNPTSVSVNEGAGASFSAAASGTPAPTVQWQLSTDGGASWSDIAGATATSYAIDAASLAQSGEEFRAVFTNQAGAAPTAAATLTVVALEQAPQLTTQPINEGVVVGGQVTFTAAASGQPTPTVQWQVSTDDGITWASISGATSASYTIDSASQLQNGEQLRAIFTNGAGTVTSNAVLLTVSQPIIPSITTEPAAQTVIAGHPAVFSAAASGVPTPSVQWYASIDAGASWTPIPGATAPTYSFSASPSQSGEELHAVFTNSQGSATTFAATLTVETGPAVTLQPASQSTVSGSSVSFTAIASGSPIPTVQWQLSTDNGATFSDIGGANASTYGIVASGSDSGNQYRAVFTNPAGTATSSAATLTVAVAAAPQVTQQPANRAVVAADTVSFSAGATGTPTPSVRWQVSTDGGGSWGDVSGAISATYSFTADATDNGDQYRAVFSNGSGTATSNPASLVVGADNSSVNWSGYEANQTGVTYTMASGSWIVPSVSCSSAATYSSEWVGIDGDGTSTVQQDGTDSFCAGGTATYDAWWEVYPEPSVTLPNPVSAGDLMSASVTVTLGTWTLALSDSTAGWTVSEHPTPPQTPSEGSVEWIVERPSICQGPGDCPIANLANFGTTAITNAGATANGVTSTISGVGAAPLQMIGSQGQNPDLLALPGALGLGGTGFSDVFYASS
ncbi:MAG TPA: G1 family glutamic endopeptidase [Solirubrobacteraceae bacterium]